LLNSDIPEKLWHYTSIHGFQGIVTSKRIFATEIRFLNDLEEFTHARKLADDVVQETPELGLNQYRDRYFLAKAVNSAFNTGPLHPNRLQIFVASFSAASDQLSQWRGYSRGSTGVSLGFDLKSLRPPTGTDTAVSFAPCVYDLDAKKKLIRHALHHFRDDVSGYWNNAVERSVQLKNAPDSGNVGSEAPDGNVLAGPDFGTCVVKAMEKTSADLLRITALLKNSSFHEEREWRLVLPVWKEKEFLKNPRLFRVGTTTLVPYIAYPFSSDPNAPVPLSDVILGPGSDPNSVSAAQGFLGSAGMRLVPRHSVVPYRAGGTP
jgi:hypothetical protein